MKRFLALTLMLLLCLPIPYAQAEGAHNMFTLTIEDMITSDDKTREEIPLSIILELGADPGKLRALARLTLIFEDGRPFVAAASLENGEIRAHLSGLSTGIVIPLDQLIAEFQENFEIYGRKYDELPPELISAFENLFYTLMDAYAPGQQRRGFSFPTPEEWKNRQQAMLSGLGAEKTGSQEILLFGKSLPAEQYAYEIDKMTPQEYETVPLPTFVSLGSMFSSPLQKALDRLESELYKLEEAYYTELFSGEDGMLTTEEGDVFFSERGELSLIGDTGSLLTCETTTHLPWGDEVAFSTYSELFTGSSLRYESGMRTSTDSQTHSADTSLIMESAEDGSQSLQYFAQNMQVDDETGEAVYSNRQEADWSLTSNRLSFSFSDSSVYGELDELIPLFTILTRAGADMEIRKNGMDGTLYFHESYGGDDGGDYLLEASIAAGYETGVLPEGEMVILPERTINPLTADEETLDALGSEAGMLLVQALGSLLAPADAPSKAGGALIR